MQQCILLQIFKQSICNKLTRAVCTIQIGSALMQRNVRLSISIISGLHCSVCGCTALADIEKHIDGCTRVMPCIEWLNRCQGNCAPRMHQSHQAFKLIPSLDNDCT